MNDDIYIKSHLASAGIVRGWSPSSESNIPVYNPSPIPSTFTLEMGMQKLEKEKIKKRNKILLLENGR